MNNKKLTKEELKKTQQAISKSHLLRLAGFADQIDRFVDIEMKEKINWVKILALITLIYAGGTITPSKLGKRILRTKDHISRLVDNLVKDKVVTRSRNGKDRRSVQIAITPYGLDLIKKMLTDIKSEEIFIESCLEAGDFQQFEKLLREFRSNLTEKMDKF